MQCTQACDSAIRKTKVPESPCYYHCEVFMPDSYIFNEPGSFVCVRCIIQSVIPLNDTTSPPCWNHRICKNITFIRLQLSGGDKRDHAWTKTWDSFSRNARSRLVKIAKLSIGTNKENAAAIHTVSFVLQFQSSCWRTITYSRTESRVRREILSTYASNERRDLIGFNRRLHGQPDGVRGPTFFKRKKGKKTDGTWAVHLFALAARYIGLLLLIFLRFTHARTHASMERHRNRSCVIHHFSTLCLFRYSNKNKFTTHGKSENAESTPKH